MQGTYTDHDPSRPPATRYPPFVGSDRELAKVQWWRWRLIHQPFPKATMHLSSYKWAGVLIEKRSEL